MSCASLHPRLRSTTRDPLLRHRFLNQRLVNLRRFVVSLFGNSPFFFANLPLLRLPTDVDRLAAPLGRLLRRADRLVVHDDEDQIGVDAWQDADGDPTGMRNVDVEGERLFAAVRFDLFRGSNVAIDDHFDRDFAGVSDASPLDVPVRFRVERELRIRRVSSVLLRSQQGRDVERDGDLARFVEV